jgi:hypothetical protein
MLETIEVNYKPAHKYGRTVIYRPRPSNGSPNSGIHKNWATPWKTSSGRPGCPT